MIQYIYAEVFLSHPVTKYIMTCFYWNVSPDHGRLLTPQVEHVARSASFMASVT